MAAYILSSAATNTMLRTSAQHFRKCAAGSLRSGLPAWNLGALRVGHIPSSSLSASAVDTAQPGDSVEVHYTGTLDSGEVFDSSRGRSPLSFTIGGGQVIKGFDTAVTGLSIGETRKQRIEPHEAYGEKSDKRIFRIPLDKCPPGLEVGAMVELANGMPATISEVTETDVEIDTNHRLAGKALTFDVELVGMKKA